MTHEATVARLDDFIAKIRNRSGAATAKACRSVLSGVMGYAARRGAIPQIQYATSAASPASTAAG